MVQYIKYKIYGKYRKNLDISELIPGNIYILDAD